MGTAGEEGRATQRETAVAHRAVGAGDVRPERLPLPLLPRPRRFREVGIPGRLVERALPRRKRRKVRQLAARPVCVAVKNVQGRRHRFHLDQRHVELRGAGLPAQRPQLASNAGAEIPVPGNRLIHFAVQLPNARHLLAPRPVRRDLPDVLEAAREPQPVLPPRRDVLVDHVLQHPRGAGPRHLERIRQSL